MSEWWLLSILGVLAIFSTGLMVYPVLKNSKMSMGLSLLILSILSFSYFTWGGFTGFQKHLHYQKAKILAQNMMQSFKNPEDLINTLKSKLNDSPESAKGWYLLGRIYSNQNKNLKAISAFAKAHQLKPKNEQFTVYYAHSLWTANQQKFNPEIIRLFETLLKNNPNQTDALAMLAMHAFLNKEGAKAVAYWQRLLRLVPRGSEEEAYLRRAIAKAQRV